MFHCRSRSRPPGRCGGFFHYKDHRGDNAIRGWLTKEKVEVRQIAKFQVFIDSLKSGGPDMVPGFISGPVAKDIYKAKVKGNKGMVQLRPRLCYGPVNEFEFTFLVGAIEKGGKDMPTTCNVTAQENRIIIIADKTRRTDERLDGKPSPKLPR